MTTETGAELRVRVRRHLTLYPMLTAYEIARALGLDCRGSGQGRVRRQLRLMEGDGEARGVPGPRSAEDHRATVRWVAT